MTNLPELLAKLAEVAPEACQKYGDCYDFSSYRFDFLSDGSLRGSTGSAGEIGQPAHAWLLDSLMLVCEGKGWKYQHTNNPKTKEHMVKVDGVGGWEIDKTTAWITSLIYAIERSKL